MVTVKHNLPEVPCLTHNPIFMYSYDHFQTPIPFNPTIAVPIDLVIEQKMDALWCLESQIESLWYKGNFVEINPVPKDSEQRAKRKQDFFDQWTPRWSQQAEQYKSLIEEVYGYEIASRTKYAESFEVCEYGRQPSRKELLEFFPTIQ